MHTSPKFKIFHLFFFHSSLLFYRVGEGAVANLRTEVWDHMLHLCLPYYDAHESGETMSRITQDTNVVKEFVTEQLVSFVSGLFAILGAVVVLLWIDWKMTLLLLIAVPLAIFVTYPLGDKMYELSKANQDELAGLLRFLATAVHKSQLAPLRQVNSWQS